MAYYYKYNFVSPERIYAKVKEELRSYFDTGVVDDLLFPIWTQDCLDHLGQGSYKISETVLEVDGYTAKLPSDFIAVREAWICTQLRREVPIPGALYTQTTMRLTPDADICSTDGCDGCDPCAPDIMHITYKSTTKVHASFRVNYMLKPGKITALDNCDLVCNNVGSYALESFDIVGNKFVTNFNDGLVYLTYYSTSVGECGYPLIPDNFRIRTYIEAYIKYKLFEQIYNSVTDETFNQVERKFVTYKQISDEAYINANIESKKETIYDKQRAIVRSYNRFNPYNIS